MQADRDVGERARYHLFLSAKLVGDVGEELGHGLGHVGAGEEVAHIRVAELLVQVHDLGGVDLYAAGRRDVRLHRDVRDVFLLLRVRCLDLDQVVPVPALLEHVNRDVRIVRDERRLEHRGRVRVERCCGCRDALRARVVGRVDQDAT